MASQDPFDTTQGSPSPAPRSLGPSLQFSRPAPKGKRSTNDLKKVSSRASIKQQYQSDSDSIHSLGRDMTRSVSPAPSALSADLSADLSHLSLPHSDTQDGGLELASEALQRLIEEAHTSTFAAGALGQKLLDQQEQMRQLMQQLEDLSEQGNNRSATFSGATSSASQSLLHRIQTDIRRMKGEQQDLITKLLQASNTDMGAIGISATTRAEAEAIIHSYGGMTESTSYNSVSATPTKPTSNNARELRRQRNAAAPNLNKDEVLVNDIQQQLINELRRLQALVAERDKALAALAENLEEASRLKAMQEANIKKLELEKDSKDASLYEAETKEALAREENEEVTRQLKKNENEVRLLRRQLGEKIDSAESLKFTNEELDRKIEDLLSSVATLKAKGAADQMTITGLKSQVGDLEIKQRQAAVSKIPPSASTLSNNTSLDHTSVDSMYGIDLTAGAAGPAGRRSGAHNEALSPSASMDDSMLNRLRPSEALKALEADVAKWKNAALKYRKKWSDERRQGAAEGRSKAQEYDDSTDEDEAAWMDEAAKSTDVAQRRSNSIRSRLVSSLSIRKPSKTMGDAFGIARNGQRITSSTSQPGWEEEGSENDRSFPTGDDDESSNGGDSTRGSMDGFDPHFADPTIRSGGATKGSKRRSTYTPANVAAAKGSPLARQLQLASGSDDESGSVGNDRPSSIIFQPGALGDELRDLHQTPDSTAIEELQEQHRMALESALAEKDDLLRAALAEQDDEHQAALAEKVGHFENLLHQREIALQSIIEEKEQAHRAALVQRDGAHQDQVLALQKEHKEGLSVFTAAHAKAIAQLQEKHTHTLGKRDTENEVLVNELQGKHDIKVRDVTDRLTKQHEQAMVDARARHAEALSKTREEVQAGLIAAQSEHKKQLEERERLHVLERERTGVQHERAVAQLEQAHRDHLDDVHSTNEVFLRDRDRHFAKEIEVREALLKAREEDIALLRGRLSTLENELERLRQLSAKEEERGKVHSRLLEEARDQIRLEKEQREAVEDKLMAATSTAGADRKMSIDTVDVFQDAHDGSMSERTFANGELEGDDTIGAVEMLRQDTTSSAETEVIKTPLQETSPTITMDARKDTGAQTDDDMWASYQRAQIESLLPPLNAPQPAPVASGGGEVSSLPKAATVEETQVSPAALVMPPPSSIPAKNPLPSFVTEAASASEHSHDEAPGRPLSPPPTELVSKAKSKLRIPAPEQQNSSTGRTSSRTSGPPPSAYVDRSIGGRASRASLGGKGPRGSARPSMGNKRDTDSASIASRSSAVRYGRTDARAPSAMSFASGYTSDASRASVVSSRASDYREVRAGGDQRSMIVGPGGQPVSTDPHVLNSITQTMIGEYLYKYTRRSMGRAGHSGKRHQRYFWLHPYTRTLYWTLQAPSEAVASETVNKSAFIQDVLVVDDDNNSPPGLYHMSILVMTQAREVKITAPSKEKHDLWVTALGYLVNRDMGTPAVERTPSEWRQSISRASGTASRLRSRTSGPAMSGDKSASLNKRPSLLSPARSFASLARRNASTDDVNDRTPRARGMSVSQAAGAGLTGRASTQRSDTAAKEYLESWEALKTFSSKPASTKVPIVTSNASTTGRTGRRSAMSKRSEDILPDGTDVRMMTPEQLMEMDAAENGFDGLENVRACCDGRHDVGELAHKHFHQQHGSTAGKASGRDSVGSRRARASTTSAAGSITSSTRQRVPKAKAEDGRLRLTGNTAPQLGPLNLNTLNNSSFHDDVSMTSSNTIKGKAITSNDHFPTATEFGDMMTRGAGSQPPSAPSSPKVQSGSTTYTDRIAQIRRARQPLLR